MTNGNLKYLTRRTASDKLLRDKVFNVAKNSSMMNIIEILL